jgi:peroxiredoxin
MLRLFKLSLFLGFFMLVLSTNAEAKGFVVQGVVKNLAGKKLFLMRYEGFVNLKVDSVLIQDSSFKFIQQQAPVGNLYALQYELNKQQRLEFLIFENTRIKILFNAMEPTSSCVIRGNKEAESFAEYAKLATIVGVALDSLQKQALPKCKNAQDSASVTNRINDVSKQVGQWQLDYLKYNKSGFFSSLLKSMPEPELPDSIAYVPGNPLTPSQVFFLRKNYWKFFDYKQEALARSPLYAFKIKNYFTVLTNSQPDSFRQSVAAHFATLEKYPLHYQIALNTLLNQAEYSNVIGMDENFVTLIEDYVMAQKTPWMSDSLQKVYIKKAQGYSKSTLGKVAPALVLASDDNSEMSLQKIVPLAKYTVLIFYDPNCSHCKEEVPRMDSVVRALRGKYDLQIFGVCNGNDHDAWRKLIADKKLDGIWHHARVGAVQPTFRQDYSVFTNPVIYLIDNKGVIVGKKFDALHLETYLQRLETNTIFRHSQGVNK